MLRVGLVNLGNTCYLNSTLQVLNRMNELKSAILATKPLKEASLELKLSLAMKDVFQKLENSGEAITPKVFLAVFFDAFPQFAERDEEHNAFKQQDADECFQLLLNSLEPLFDQGGNHLFSELFEIRFKVTFFNKASISVN